MRTLCTLAFATITVACSGATSDGEANPASASRGLTASCEGSIRCTAGPTETSATLRRDAKATGCIVQSATLLPGGVVEGKADASWTGDEDSVRVCQGPSCFTCERSDEAPPNGRGEKPKKEKSCTGVAYCPSSPPCAAVLGCSTRAHYNYDGRGNVRYVDYSCDGSATSCSSMSAADSCERQGCRWE